MVPCQTTKPGTPELPVRAVIKRRPPGVFRSLDKFQASGPESEPESENDQFTRILFRGVSNLLSADTGIVAVKENISPSVYVMKKILR